MAATDGVMNRGPHRTRVRRRRDLWVVSCSCGWWTETVSEFGAWAASKRHLEHPQPGPRSARERVPGQDHRHELLVKLLVISVPYHYGQRGGSRVARRR